MKRFLQRGCNRSSCCIGIQRTSIVTVCFVQFGQVLQFKLVKGFISLLAEFHKLCHAPTILKLKEVSRVVRMDSGCADGVWIVFMLSPFGRRIEWDGVIVLHNVFLHEI